MNKKIVLIVTGLILLLFICCCVSGGLGIFFFQSASRIENSSSFNLVKIENGVGLSPATKFSLSISENGMFEYTDYLDKVTKGEIDSKELVDITVDVNTLRNINVIEDEATAENLCCDIPSQTMTFYKFDGTEEKTVNIQLIKDPENKEKYQQLFIKVRDSVLDKIK